MGRQQRLDVEEYTKQLTNEINNIIKDLYMKTLVSKFEPYEIDYTIKGLNFRKENYTNYFTYSGIKVFDPNKIFILKPDESYYDDDIKEDLIKNELIKGSFKDRIKFRLIKLWYKFEFICFYYKYKIIKRKNE